MVSYEYNWQGLRTKKVTAVRTENYYYTGDDLTYITDATNKVKYFFTRDTSGALLHMIDYTGTTPAIYFYIRDAHGNIVALADNTGVRKVNYEYDAWGLLINVPENNVFTGNGELLRDANPFRYSGYQFDPETEFYYLKNRYYSAYIGRFITEDAVMTRNRYMYCSNNPANLVDPSGLHEENIDDGGGGGNSNPYKPPFIEEINKIGSDILKANADLIIEKAVFSATQRAVTYTEWHTVELTKRSGNTMKYIENPKLIKGARGTAVLGAVSLGVVGYEAYGNYEKYGLEKATYAAGVDLVALGLSVVATAALAPFVIGFLGIAAAGTAATLTFIGVGVITGLILEIPSSAIKKEILE